MILLIALLLAQAHPCQEDAHKLCPGMRTSDPKLAACLKEHKAEVSPACSARMAEFKSEAEACKADVEKLCPGLPAGPERLACMRAHKDQVSVPCLEFYAKLRERDGGEAKAACQPDLEKFCKDVRPGEGRIIACLKQHQADLSPACAAQMKR